jgi:hypothetical protein
VPMEEWKIVMTIINENLQNVKEENQKDEL